VFAAVADTRGGILAENGRVADVDQQPTDALDAAADLLGRCLADAGLTASDLAGVAAGIPCPLDANTGVVRSPTILAAWVDLDPARELAGRIGHPVYVDNDANMGARGEQRFGAARGCRHFNRYAQPAAAQAVSIRVAELGLRAELVGAIATALARVA
jgi:predicted NBD/HSP70 family sugar kinase